MGPKRRKCSNRQKGQLRSGLEQVVRIARQDDESRSSQGIEERDSSTSPPGETDYVNKDSGPDDRCATFSQRGVYGDENNHSRESQAAMQHLATSRNKQPSGNHAQMQSGDGEQMNGPAAEEGIRLLTRQTAPRPQQNGYGQAVRIRSQMLRQNPVAASA
jgi:hypothetical protein